MEARDVMFFRGVSTWVGGQLEEELRRGTWVPVVAPLAVAIGARRTLWSDMMHALGGEYAEFGDMPPIPDL